MGGQTMGRCRGRRRGARGRAPRNEWTGREAKPGPEPKPRSRPFLRRQFLGLPSGAPLAGTALVSTLAVTAPTPAAAQVFIGSNRSVTFTNNRDYIFVGTSVFVDAFGTGAFIDLTNRGNLAVAGIDSRAVFARSTEPVSAITIPIPATSPPPGSGDSEFSGAHMTATAPPPSSTAATSRRSESTRTAFSVAPTSATAMS